MVVQRLSYATCASWARGGSLLLKTHILLKHRLHYIKSKWLVGWLGQSSVHTPDLGNEWGAHHGFYPFLINFIISFINYYFNLENNGNVMGPTEFFFYILFEATIHSDISRYSCEYDNRGHGSGKRIQWEKK